MASTADSTSLSSLVGESLVKAPESAHTGSVQTNLMNSPSSSIKKKILKKKKLSNQS